MSTNYYYQQCLNNIGRPVEIHSEGKVHYGIINHVTDDQVYILPMPDPDQSMNEGPGTFAWGLGPMMGGMGGFGRGFGGYGGGYGMGFPFSGIGALSFLPFLFW